jgi:hypothetical protein
MAGDDRDGCRDKGEGGRDLGIAGAVRIHKMIMQTAIALLGTAALT